MIDYIYVRLDGLVDERNPLCIEAVSSGIPGSNPVRSISFLRNILLPHFEKWLFPVGLFVVLCFGLQRFVSA